MDDLIAQYEQQYQVLCDLIERYKTALKQARAKGQNIKSAQIYRKIETMYAEKVEISYAIRQMRRNT